LKRHVRGDFSPEGWIEQPRQPFHPAPTLSPSKPVSLQALLDGWATAGQRRFRWLLMRAADIPAA
jgi:hypothetical protein